MKAILLAFTLSVLSISTGCKMNPSENKAALPILDLGAAIGKQTPDTFTWNNIAKQITYVPISTSSDALFGSTQLVHMDRDCYYMVDHKTQAIFRTDKSGKVMSSILKKGQGPGEYNVLSYVHVNMADSIIQVLDQRGDEYIVYDLAGNLIQDIYLKEKNIGMPILVSDNYMVARGREETDHKLYITDKDLNIQERLFPIDTALTEMERLCLAGQINFCRNRDLAVVNFANEDTVFAVTEEGVQPLCIFEKGEYGLPEEEATKMMEMTPQGSPYIRTMWLSSVPDYYLITYMLKNVFYDEVWSKADNRIVARFSNENGEWGIPFCLPSGKKIRLNSRSLYINGNIVAAFIDAATAAEGEVVGVDEDDNPVLVVMEL